MSTEEPRLVVHHNKSECAEEIRKFVEAARLCAEEGLVATSELDLRYRAAWEKYYYAKAVRALMLFFTATFVEGCACKSAHGVPWWRGLPPGFWPSDASLKETECTP